MPKTVKYAMRHRPPTEWTALHHSTHGRRVRHVPSAHRPMMVPVLEAIRVAYRTRGRPRRRPRRVLADKAYSSQADRAWLRAHHTRATIPLKADQAAHRRARGSRGGRPPAFDAVTYKNRSTVERGFSHLRHHRALATRYDKLAVRYQATIHITSINHRLKRLTKQTLDEYAQRVPLGGVSSGGGPGRGRPGPRRFPWSRLRW